MVLLGTKVVQGLTAKERGCCHLLDGLPHDMGGDIFGELGARKLLGAGRAIGPGALFAEAHSDLCVQALGT